MLSLAAVSPSGARERFPSGPAVGAACPRGESFAAGRLQAVDGNNVLRINS